MTINMADWVEIGQTAPDFTLKNDEGEDIKLSSLRGKPVVLYFYPADDTPGCTTEACAFRDSRSAWSGTGARVFGISPDDVESHAKFRKKYDLNFSLLADPEHKIGDLYGAWREKNMYGKVSMGIVRSTYILDAMGKVTHLWKRVKVEEHDQKVIEALKSLK
jgi:peroxiredoxin Q/BCP